MGSQRFPPFPGRGPGSLPPSLGSLVSPPGCPTPGPAPELPAPHRKPGGEWICRKEKQSETPGPLCSQVPAPRAGARSWRTGTRRLGQEGGWWSLLLQPNGANKVKSPEESVRTMIGRMSARPRAGAWGLPCSLSVVFSRASCFYQPKIH